MQPRHGVVRITKFMPEDMLYVGKQILRGKLVVGGETNLIELRNAVSSSAAIFWDCNQGNDPNNP